MVSIKFFLPGSARSLILLENENCEYKMIRGELQTDTKPDKKTVEKLKRFPIIRQLNIAVVTSREKKRKKRKKGVNLESNFRNGDNYFPNYFQCYIKVNNLNLPIFLSSK